MDTMSVEITPPGLEALLPLARDMTASLTAEDRNKRLIEVVCRALNCDAAALLRLEGDMLVPVVCFGLSPEIYGRRFARSEHPRLDTACSSRKATIFPADSNLPDPFDDFVLVGDDPRSARVHSCLACPLIVEGELVGILTADALEPGVFDKLTPEFLEHLSALAGASLRTTALIEALHDRAHRQGLLALELARDTENREGSILLGTSTPIQKLRDETELVGRSDLPVLVYGETGVGKELVARMLHGSSSRRDAPLVYVNCAALPESISESELFGHVKGAFTGADKNRPGKFKIADGTTLFLDEIGELPLSTQPKLLRVLQEGEIQAVGSDRYEKVDVRILAATNRDLGVEVSEGRFRADLLHRLDVCRIQIPPLREHREDIPMLAGHFADQARSRLGTGPIRFSTEAQDTIMANDWPGNVRELSNVILRASLHAAARAEKGATVMVEASDLPVSAVEAASLNGAVTDPTPAELGSLRNAVKEFQRRQIKHALQTTGSSWSQAAKALGMDRANLHHLAKRLRMK